MENIMTKSNTQTNAIPSYELIAESIINEWNLASLDTPDRQFNQASGEENVYYNSDVVYLLGDICNQLAFSLVGNMKDGIVRGKQGYLDKCEQLANDEQRNNPDTYIGSMADTKKQQATASYDNAYMMFNAMTATFNAITGWTWGGSLTANDKGRTWYQMHKDSMSSLRYTAKTKINDADTRKAMLARLSSKK
jgi:hypothetical protein